MSIRNIQVEVTRHGPYTTAHQYVVRVDYRVVSVVGDDLDVNLFIARHAKHRDDAQTPYDKFQGVAGPAELTSFPLAEPDPEAHYPFFLTDQVTIWHKTYEDQTAFETFLNLDFNGLLAALDSSDRIVGTETWSFGDDVGDSDSLSG